MFGSICFAVFVTYVTCFCLNSLESAILFAYKGKVPIIAE